MLRHKQKCGVAPCGLGALIGAGRRGGKPFDAGAILRQLDSPRGVCVLLADAPAEPAAALAGQSELVIYVQHPIARSSRRPGESRQTRLLGTRVFVEEGPGRDHLADQLADAVVSCPRESPTLRHKAELLRAIRPSAS